MIIQCETENEWHEQRRLSLGGSDAPALFGLGFKSALRVAMEKLGKTQPEVASEEMQMGHLLEPAIRAIYTKKTGRQVSYPGPFTIHRSEEHPLIHCTLDGRVHDLNMDGPELKNGPGVLQCKMSNAHPREWEEGTALRLALEVQLNHEMLATGWAWGSAAVFVTHFRNHFITFDIQRNDVFCEKLIEKERAFWEDLHRGIYPAPTSRDDDHTLIRTLYPNDDGKTVFLEGVHHIQALDEMEEAERQRKLAEHREKRAKNVLEMAIGGNTRAVLDDGTRLTLRTSSDGKRTLKREWTPR